jgi:hypothetical protein
VTCVSRYEVCSSSSIDKDYDCGGGGGGGGGDDDDGGI